MAHKIKMHTVNADNERVQLYPETVASQVIVESTGQTLEDMFGGTGTIPLTNDQIEIIDTLSTDLPIYVDPVNGDDANVGTLDRPFKTARAASDYINKRNFVGKRVNLVLKQGTYVNDIVEIRYVGILNVLTYDGDVVFEGTPLTSAGSMFVNMFFDHIGIVKFSGTHKVTVKPNAVEVKTSASLYPIYFNYVSSGFIGPSTIVDGINSDPSKTYYKDVRFGITVGYSSNVEIRATVTNTDRPIFVTNNSRVLISQASIDGGSIRTSLGSVVSRATSQVLDGATYENDGTSIILHQANNNTIVESGSNDMGSYIKYADGRAEIRYFQNTRHLSDMSDSLSPGIAGRYFLPFPITLRSISSASVDGYLTDDNASFIRGANVRIGTVGVDGIHIFTDDILYEGSVGISPRMTNIRSLTYTVTGRWK